MASCLCGNKCCGSHLVQRQGNESGLRVWLRVARENTSIDDLLLYHYGALRFTELLTEAFTVASLDESLLNNAQRHDDYPAGALTGSR